jgi:transcriptional regulator with XRE-family HTH domain
MKKEKGDIDIQSLFSLNLKRLRTRANITQLGLAKAAGLTHNFINDLENGKKWVSSNTISQLAKALKAEPYQFFLSESFWNDESTELFSLYLNDFTDSVNDLVSAYRQRYLGGGVHTKFPNTKTTNSAAFPLRFHS